ncbi:uncharacterized protein [Venturia canescens]|uniref:uncharacterized protein n=1 Tax=Venturia canescens TaxID=32260 RepID=UPI001C9C30A9|nr:uncharacterized protein LOC122410818 [Venturia canescens]
MLCCVSRKASPRSSDKKSDGHEAHEKPVLRHDSESSSGVSSSSFDNSDRFISSLSSDSTPSSSSSQNTSGFSSSAYSTIRKFTDSSTDTLPIPSEFSSNYDDASDFLTNNSKAIHTIDPNSPKKQFPETPKRLKTFSAPAKHDDNLELSDTSTKDEPSELLPCAICARTFKPQSLEKHTQICERAAIKKRKPFDSAKQRIQGTELAEFLPKETIKRKVYQTEDKGCGNRGSWKQTHDEFLRAIRAARGETVEGSRAASNNVTVGVPTRPNEKGMCPSCNRQFSIKSYERHVEWCKDRATKAPVSAATNIAKERLEARMKYRAPALKNRRATVREKYSPSSATHLGSSTSTRVNNGNSSNERPKEAASTANRDEKMGHENPAGSCRPQRSTASTRRSGAGRDGTTTGPMKSRLSDRSNSLIDRYFANRSFRAARFSAPQCPPPNDQKHSSPLTVFLLLHLRRPSAENDPGPASDVPTPRGASSRPSDAPVPRHSRNSPQTHFSRGSNASARYSRKSHDPMELRDEGEEYSDERKDERRAKLRGSNETWTRHRRAQRNIVQARSHGNPRVNGVAINDDVLGMIVQPCNRKKIHNGEPEFVTWKKISEDDFGRNDFLKFHSVTAAKSDDEPAPFETLRFPHWTSADEKLDETYSVGEPLEGDTELGELLDGRKSRPVIEPRETPPGARSESERKLPRSVLENSAFLTCSNLEPLNLRNVESADEPETSLERSCRSEQSTVRKSSRRKSRKSLPEVGERALGKEPPTSDLGSSNSISRHSSRAIRISNSLRDPRSPKKSTGKEPSSETDEKNDGSEPIGVAKTSRSSKSTTSINDSVDELFKKKVTEVYELVDGNEFVARESLNFQLREEENPRKRYSEDVSPELDKPERSPEIPEPSIGDKSAKSGEDSSRRARRTDSKESFSHDPFSEASRSDKNFGEPTGNNVAKKNRRRNDKVVSAPGTSRTQKNAQPPKPNCEDLLTKKLARMHSIAKNLHFPVDDHSKRGNSKKKVFPRDSEVDSDKKTSLPVDRVTENTRTKENEKIPEAASDRAQNPTRFSEKENETKAETKINYRRCKTYVIDKKSDHEKKHHAPPGFPDGKPEQKRRKIENFERAEVETEMPQPVGTEEDKIENGLEKCVKESENATEIEAVKSVPECSKKYVNSNLNNDSDETLMSENCRRDSEPGSSTKKQENSSSFDVHEFSDSYLPRKQIPLETFFGTQENREGENVQRSISEFEPIPTAPNLEESRTKNSGEVTLWVIEKQAEVEESPEVTKNNGDTSPLDATFSGDESPEIQNSPETSRKHVKNPPEKSHRGSVEAPEFRDCDKRIEKPNSENRVLPEAVEKSEQQSASATRKKLREKKEILREDTNDLIASVESVDEVSSRRNSLANVGSPESRSLGEIEEETIQEIFFQKFGDTYESKLGTCGFLPEIPVDRIAARNENSKNAKRLLGFDAAPFAWQRGTKNSSVRLISLDAPKYHRETKIPCKRLAHVTNLPPVVPFGREKRRIFDRDFRAVWSKYVRRHPDFNLVLTGRTGSCPEYDPFLIAERQMNELLSDTCSEKSVTDSSSNRRRSSLSPTLPSYPLTHSSAFVKYGDSPVGKMAKLPEKRVSLIAPPTEFDDFSSDSTETNSISREISNGYNTNSRSRDARHENEEARRKNGGRDHVLGRRVIIDKSKALGVKDMYDDTASIRSLLENSSGNGKVRKLFEKKTSPKVTRSNSVRTNLSQKTNDKKINNSGHSPNDKLNNIQNHRNNNYPSLSGSNVSLSSIVSSDVEVKRSNSAFDELASSCDDDTSPTYPSLTYLLKNDSLSIASPVQSNRQRNGQISDEEFSSPDSFKRHHEHNKLSADSAYSSLNRKYSNHGRSTNEMIGRHEEDSPLHRREAETVGSITRSKLSKFCHECGSKFPDTAKFCCECGIKRLAL